METKGEKRELKPKDISHSVYKWMISVFVAQQIVIAMGERERERERTNGIIKRRKIKVLQ